MKNVGSERAIHCRDACIVCAFIYTYIKLLLFQQASLLIYNCADGCCTVIILLRIVLIAQELSSPLK